MTAYLQRASILVLPLVIALVAPARGQCPSAAPGFGPPGTDGQVFDLVEFDDGSGPALFAGGRFGAVGEAAAASVARWNGASWSSVGDGPGGRVEELAVLDLGGGPKLYAAGGPLLLGPTAGPAFVSCWDGASWQPVGPPFVLAGGGSPTILALAVYAEGGIPKLFAAGVKNRSLGDSIPFVARLDGSTWTELPPGPITSPDPFFTDMLQWGSVSELAVHDDGSGPKLYAGGTFDRVGTTVASNLARWNGASWSPVGSSGVGNLNQPVTSLRVHDDGSGPALLVSGEFGPNSVLRWNGSSYLYVGATPGDVQFLDHFEAASGRPAGLWIVLASTGALARFDGASWILEATPAFDGFGYVHSAATFGAPGSREIYLGGEFRAASPSFATDVLRWSGSSFAGTADGAPLHGTSVPRVQAQVVHDRGFGPELYVGGRFSYAGVEDLQCSSIARWTGSAWADLGPNLGVSSEVRGLASVDVGNGPELWIAGNLFPGGQQYIFMHFDGSSLAGIPANHAGSSGRAFEVVDKPSGTEIYALKDSGLLRWNGSALASVTNLVSGTLRAMQAFDDGTGPALYVAGRFTSIGGIAANGVARFDGTSWTALGAGLSGSGDWTVETLTVHDDGDGERLWAGGRFASSGGTVLSNVATWDGATWADVGGGIGGIGGVGGVEARVLSLASFDDGRGEGAVLVAGGTFSIAGGVPARNVARWNGAAWSEFAGGSSGPNPAVLHLLGVDAAALGGRFLYAGGDFSAIGGTSSSHFARIEPCDEIGRTFCHGDGSEAACPCGNDSASGARAGCSNSLGLAGTTRARGRASLSDDTLSLDGAGMPNSSALYFQAANRQAAVTFGDGLTCTAGPFVRLGTKTNSANASSYPAAGDPTLSVRGMVLAPGTRHYQVRYRNAADFCSAETFNYTNAVTIEWGA